MVARCSRSVRRFHDGSLTEVTRRAADWQAVAPPYCTRRRHSDFVMRPRHAPRGAVDSASGQPRPAPRPHRAVVVGRGVSGRGFQCGAVARAVARASLPAVLASSASMACGVLACLPPGLSKGPVCLSQGEALGRSARMDAVPGQSTPRTVQANHCLIRKMRLQRPFIRLCMNFLPPRR